MSIPKLRFSEFHSDWKNITLGSLSKLVTSGSRDWAQHYSEVGSKFIRMTNLSRDRIDLLLDDMKYVDVSSNSSDGRRTSLIPGDILMSITAELGKIGLIPDGFGEAYINQHTALIRLNEGVNPRFIAQLLGTKRQNRKINKLNDAGAKAGLNLPTIKSLLIAIPESGEQKKIASFLSFIDLKIENLIKRHELLAQYKKGVMQKIFNQEIRFKDGNGQDFPGWVMMLLGDTADFYKGKGISKAEIVDDGITPCIRYGELYTHYGVTIDKVTSKTNTPTKELFLSETNDVIIPASGETQIDIATASCVMLGGVALGGDLNIIRSSQNGVFLSYYLNSQKKIDIAKLAQGNSVVHLYASQLKGLDISLPALPEQELIANFLSKIDLRIQLIQSQIELTKKFKQGLLQQMFV